MKAELPTHVTQLEECQQVATVLHANDIRPRDTGPDSRKAKRTNTHPPPYRSAYCVRQASSGFCMWQV